MAPEAGLETGRKKGLMDGRGSAAEIPLGCFLSEPNGARGCCDQDWGLGDTLELSADWWLGVIPSGLAAGIKISNPGKLNPKLDLMEEKK